MFKKLSLSAKLLSIVITISILAFGVTVGYTAISVFGTSSENSEELAHEEAAHFGAVIDAELEVPMDTARTLAHTLEGLKSSGETERETVEEVLANILAKNENFIGAWTCWEPNAFDGDDANYVNTGTSDKTGRFIPYYYKSGSGIASEPLIGYETPGDGDYYLLARDSGNETIIDPYSYEIGGKQVLITTVSVPIKYNDRVVGVAGIDVELDYLQAMIQDIRPYETGYAVLIDSSGNYAAHPDPSSIGKQMLLDEDGTNKAKVLAGEEYHVTMFSSINDSEVFISYVPVEVGNSDTPWSFAVAFPTDKIMAEAKSLTILMIIIAVVALAVLIAATFLVVRSIVKPIKKIADIAQKISEGDLKQTIDIDSKDEIGQMANALRGMINGVIGEGQSIKTGITDPFFVADKDLTVTYMNEACGKLTGYAPEEVIGKMKCKDLFKSDICETSCALKKSMADGTVFSGVKVKIEDRDGKKIPIVVSAASLKDLEGNVIGGYELARDITNETEIQKNVEEVTEQVTSAAGQIASSSEEMASGAEEQARQTGEVATAMEEMSETILETSKNAEGALKAANEANKSSEEGGKIIAETMTAIKEIAESTKTIVDVLNTLSAQSEEIGNVVEVIDDIADQTNLLAVNAAIEAARAGEHGRGFAVVADEVRKLAERTLKTTKEVTSTVQSIQKGTKDTVEAVNEYSEKTTAVVEKANMAQESFHQIVDGSKRVIDISQQVATAADEQSSAAEEISKNIESVASVTKQVASGAQQSSSAAQQLDQLAKKLSEVVAKLN
jgi:methyl-accepting chemotaxis protein